MSLQFMSLLQEEIPVYLERPLHILNLQALHNNTGVTWRTFDRDQTRSGSNLSVAIGSLEQAEGGSQSRSRTSIRIGLERDQERPVWHRYNFWEALPKFAIYKQSWSKCMEPFWSIVTDVLCMHITYQARTIITAATLARFAKSLVW